MLRLIWGADALDDLEEIARFIAKRNPSAADRIQGLIEAAAEKLPLHPYMYRTGRIPGTREAVVHPNYLVIYRIGVDVIDIVAVLHARQQYP